MNTFDQSVFLFLFAVAFAALGFVVAILFLRLKSRNFRKKHALPNILGKWHCQWFDDQFEADSPKIEDTMEIKTWLRDGEFEAVGHQPQFLLSYPITGEIDPSRVITLEYRAEKYPYEPNRGVVCMVLSRDGETMEGKWYGRRFSGELGGGKVICKRIMETA
jgi:hypothetical protein